MTVTKRQIEGARLERMALWYQEVICIPVFIFEDKLCKALKTRNHYIISNVFDWLWQQVL